MAAESRPHLSGEAGAQHGPPILRFAAELGQVAELNGQVAGVAQARIGPSRPDRYRDKTVPRAPKKTGFAIHRPGPL